MTRIIRDDQVRVYWVTDGPVIKVTQERRQTLMLEGLPGAVLEANKLWMWETGRVSVNPPTLKELLPKLVPRQTQAEARPLRTQFLDAYRRYNDITFAC